MANDNKVIVTIRGEHIRTLEEFYSEMGRAVNGNKGYFGNDLDSFNDCLRGGFGVEPPFTIEWTSSEMSKAALGYRETERQLRKRLAHCHSSAKQGVRDLLINAESEAGPTVFDWLVEVMRNAEGVTLELR